MWGEAEYFQEVRYIHDGISFSLRPFQGISTLQRKSFRFAEARLRYCQKGVSSSARSDGIQSNLDWISPSIQVSQNVIFQPNIPLCTFFAGVIYARNYWLEPWLVKTSKYHLSPLYPQYLTPAKWKREKESSSYPEKSEKIEKRGRWHFPSLRN